MGVEVFLPGFCRFFGGLLFLPLEAIGFQVWRKIMLAAGLALLVGPNASSGIMLVAEILIGIVVSLPIVFFLEFLQTGSELFDTARGSSMDVTYAPELQHQEHVLQHLFRALGLAFFFSGDAALTFFRALATIPIVPTVSSELLIAALIRMAIELLGLLGSLFFPFVLLCAAVEFAGGLIARSLPGLSVGNELFTIKFITGFIFMILIFNSGVHEEVTEGLIGGIQLLCGAILSE